ncbi:MAG: hypothetical protein JXA66_05545, partial [Oligoflexia bacterium]|nr:hypothetical protein [Oligoflexia bacterium]
FLSVIMFAGCNDSMFGLANIDLNDGETDFGDIPDGNAITLEYPSSSIVLKINREMEKVTPEVEGNPESFGIIPQLPAGLVFDTTSGAINGTAVSLLEPTEYIITACNTASCKAARLTIAVRNKIAVKIAAGLAHSCAILEDRTVECWGNNTYWQIGNFTVQDGISGPEKVLVSETGEIPLEGVIDIAAGYYHTCALIIDGTIKCWGDNMFGQTGNGSPDYYNCATNVEDIDNAVSMDAKGYHTCAALADKTVKCWGANYFYQLGNSEMYQSEEPVQVEGIDSATGVGLGEEYSCAILEDGTAKCWGSNINGTLGHDTSPNDLSPIPVQIDGVSNIFDVSGGYFHSCVLNDDKVGCFGTNYYGQLGTPAIEFSYSPVFITKEDGSIFDNVTKIHSGDIHVCASSNNEVFCWGDNSLGQLGDINYQTTSNIPVKPVGLDKISDFTVGYYHSCAVSYGAVLCWGLNHTSQLGNETHEGEFTVYEAVKVDGY